CWKRLASNAFEHAKKEQGEILVKRNVFSLPLGDRLLETGQAPVSAVRMDDLVFTSGIPGVDPRTGTLPADPEAQFAFAFENMQRVLKEGGAGPDTIGLITVYTPDRSGRALIGKPWLAMYPNEDRPARKTNHAPLPNGLAVQLQAVAVLNAKRQ